MLADSFKTGEKYFYNIGSGANAKQLYAETDPNKQETTIYELMIDTQVEPGEKPKSIYVERETLSSADAFARITGNKFGTAGASQEDVDNFKRQQLLDLVQKGIIPGVYQPGMGVLKSYENVESKPFTPNE